MNAFNPQVLLTFGSVAQISFCAAKDYPNEPVADIVRQDAVARTIPNFLVECDKLGLSFSANHLRSIDAQLRIPAYQNLAYHNDWTQFYIRVREELESKLFLQVPVERAQFYTNWRSGWDEILDRFPSIELDVQEAGMCLAMGRYAASVFHLMRASEPGLYSMARSLGITRLKENWANVINEIDKLLKANSKNKPPSWKSKEVFYSDASSQFLFFKDAFRNNVMHSGSKLDFDEPRALTIYRSVQAFMRQLSTKLRERRDWR